MDILPIVSNILNTSLISSLYKQLSSNEKDEKISNGYAFLSKLWRYGIVEVVLIVILLFGGKK